MKFITAIAMILLAVPVWADPQPAEIFTAWEPTTSMFLSSSGGGTLFTWTGHAVVLRVDPTTGTPNIFVIGGGPNTFNAYADGANSSGPAAYSNIYQVSVGAGGSLGTWSSPNNGGYLPIGSILHSAVLCSTVQGNAIYVAGGANTNNAYIWAGAASRSLCAYGQVDALGRPLAVGETTVLYENVGAGIPSDGVAPISVTARIPILDPVMYDPTAAAAAAAGGFTPNTATPIYQPLIRAKAVSHAGYLYVIGGISRQNINWATGEPAKSVPEFQNRVWFCRPNTNGTINPTDINNVTAAGEFPALGNGAWATTAGLPVPLYDFGACAAHGRIYVAGGKTAGGVVQDKVYMAEIAPDGTLAGWSELSALPFPVAQHAMVFSSDGRIYLAGGSEHVYYTTPNPATGALTGGWQAGNAGLPFVSLGPGMVENQERLYLLGGVLDSVPASNVYVTGQAATPTPTPTFTPAATATVTPAPSPQAASSQTPTPVAAIPAGTRAYPNPGKGLIHFAWDSDPGDQVSVRLYNLAGERVAILQAAGANDLSWDARAVAPGVYFYQFVIRRGDREETTAFRKIAVIR